MLRGCVFSFLVFHGFMVFVISLVLRFSCCSSFESLIWFVVVVGVLFLFLGFCDYVF